MVSFKWNSKIIQDIGSNKENERYVNSSVVQPLGKSPVTHEISH